MRASGPGKDESTSLVIAIFVGMFAGIVVVNFDTVVAAAKKNWPTISVNNHNYAFTLKSGGAVRPK